MQRKYSLWFPARELGSLGTSLIYSEAGREEKEKRGTDGNCFGIKLKHPLRQSVCLSSGFIEHHGDEEEGRWGKKKVWPQTRGIFYSEWRAATQRKHTPDMSKGTGFPSVRAGMEEGTQLGGEGGRIYSGGEQ